MKIIVVAGGQGTKLWPYSRENKPKQFQPIVGDKSSYQLNIETLLKQFAPEDIFVSTKHKFIKYVSDQSPQVPLKNYIVEPDIAKDRGPAEGLAFLRLEMLHPDEPFFIVQADCLRQPEEKFLQMINTANELVQANKRFITGGIKATTPDLGSDYLQLGKEMLEGSDAFAIDAFLFRKKTMRETREMIQSFHVALHCNHACWYPGLMLEAYKKYRPDWYQSLMDIRQALDRPGERQAVEKIYATMQKGPTEDVTRNIIQDGKAMAILVPFKWTDVGTWASVYDYASDGETNYSDGNVVSVDSKGSLIKTNNPNKLIAVAGLDDLIVVDTEDALLIVPKEDADKIKDIQARLGEGEYSRYL